MTRIYLPSKGPDSWRVLLADPEGQWRPGFSAMTLACCWESAAGQLPPVIAEMFTEFSPKTETVLYSLGAFIGGPGVRA
jgi:hypothetical protein